MMPKLTPTHVKLTGERDKNRSKRKVSRDGYIDQNKQVFLPPKAPKRLKAWMERFGL